MARLYVKIKDQDNVAVAVEELKAGTEIMEGLTVNQDIPQAHKIALCDIRQEGKLFVMELFWVMPFMILNGETGSMSICLSCRKARHWIIWNTEAIW